MFMSSFEYCGGKDVDRTVYVEYSDLAWPLQSPDLGDTEVQALWQALVGLGGRLPERLFLEDGQAWERRAHEVSIDLRGNAVRGRYAPLKASP